MSRQVRRAFTLIELMCVMVLLTVAALVLGLLIREIAQIERVQAAGFNRLLETTALAELFRADVAQAESLLPEWQDYVASERTLILKTKQGHIVYLLESDHLRRRVFENGKFNEREPPLGDANLRVEFVRDRRIPKLLRLRVHRVHGSEIVPGQTIEFAAALGGDWR